MNGTFNVMLGAIDKVTNPIPASFFAQYPTTYLGIKVGNDSEMLPRQMITSVGYALFAWNGVPKGGIIMWSGAITDIPTGWALCDGANGTPNLRDRFVVGAGGSYNKDDKGGEATHILTVSEMPSHMHVQNAHTHTQNAHTHIQAAHGHSVRLENGRSSDTGASGGAKAWNYPPYGSMQSDANAIANAIATNQNTTATNQNSGGGAAHENRPPYYALAFIMKL